MIFLHYLWYVIKHKWYVFLACRKFKITWLGIVHDWSKFRLSEFVPYAKHFYGKIETGRDETGYYQAGETGDVLFDRAWFCHQSRNKHHWQYWIMPRDATLGAKDDMFVLDMPVKYVLEMVADWIGAGKAQGKPDTQAWYDKNGERLILSERTRSRVRLLLTLYA